MRITRFGGRDPMGPAARAVSPAGPAASSALGKLLTDEITQDEARIVASLDDTGLLARKHETEELIAELQTRLGIISIDLGRRCREAADASADELMQRDLKFRCVSQQTRLELEAITKQLHKLFPESAGRMNKVVSQIAHEIAYKKG